MPTTPDGAQPLDLDEVRDKWLHVCPSCDAGLPSQCTHPDEDYRPVMLDLVREVERLRTWQGIMSVVDEHYPPSVFPVIDDRLGADDGVRILSLIRHLDRARAIVDSAQTYEHVTQPLVEAVLRAARAHAEADFHWRSETYKSLRAAVSAILGEVDG